MMYALLLLGLIPAVFLPDFLAEQSDDAGDSLEPVESNDASVNLLDTLNAEPPEEALQPVLDDDLSDFEDEIEDPLPPVIEDDVLEPETAVLLPVIEDDLPSEPPQDGQEEALAPVIEDDTDPGYTDPPADEVLAPVVEDDTANQTAQDEALLPIEAIEAGDNETWLNASDLVDGSYAEISGFDVGLDVLNISFDPDHALPSLDVTVRASEDGADSEVLVGDTLIALLVDAPDVPIEDIIVTIQRLQ